MGRVVAVDYVLQDSAGFPECDIGVGIMDGGEATVGVDGDVLSALDIAHGDMDDFVGESELFENEADFGRVGTALAPDFDRFH